MLPFPLLVLEKKKRKKFQVSFELAPAGYAVSHSLRLIAGIYKERVRDRDRDRQRDRGGESVIQ